MSTVYCSYSSINNKSPYLCFLLMIHKPTSTFFLSFITYPIDNWNHFEAICQKWRKCLRIIHKNGKRNILLTYIMWVIPICQIMNWASLLMGILTSQDEMIKIRAHHSLIKHYFYLIEKSVLWFFFPLVLTYILLLLMTWWLNE